MVIDLLPIPDIDATGLLTITELVTVLEARGIELNAAGRATEWKNWTKTRGFPNFRIRIFPTLRQAVRDLSVGADTPPAAGNSG